MNKRTLRAFALGILLAAVIIEASPLLFGEKYSFDVDEAISLLEDEGYSVLTKVELEKLQEEEAKVETEERIEEEPLPEKEEKVAESSRVEENAPTTYSLVIKEGMNTKDISAILEEEGIIDARAQFDHYLIENGYSTKLQIGKFELNSEMEYEEISKIVTSLRK